MHWSASPKWNFRKWRTASFLFFHQTLLSTVQRQHSKLSSAFSKKAIVCPTGLEAAWKVHALDRSGLETANKSLQSDAILEDYENPLAGKLGTTTAPGRGLQLDRIWLILGCWLLARLVIDPLFRRGPCANNPGLVACHSVGLCSLVLVVIQGRKEGHRHECRRSLSGFTIGNQRAPKGPRLDSHISGDRLFKTGQLRSDSLEEGI